MTNRENIQSVCLANPDFLGYIFYPKSARYVGEQPDPAIFSVVPPQIQKVAVFVNEYYEKMSDVIQKYDIEVVQLHGMESPNTCAAIRNKGKKVIKVIPGDQVDNRELLKQYAGSVDYFLFDTPVISHGGSGRKFDWSKLDHLDCKVPFFLSGGIAPGDADKLMELKYNNFYAADINSRFEQEPGIKDSEMVSTFIKEIRNE